MYHRLPLLLLLAGSTRIKMVYYAAPVSCQQVRIHSLLQKRTNVLPKNQITVITAMKKQQGLVELSDGCDGRAPAHQMCSLHTSSTKKAVTQKGTLRYLDQERKQQGCCSRLVNPKPSALGSSEAKSFLEGSTQVMFPRWLCHLQPWDSIA